MKRLVFLLAVLLVGFQAYSQEIVLGKNQTYGAYTTATTVSGTTVNNMDVFVNKDYIYYYDVQWAADSAGDGTNIALQLQGSNDASNYYSIGSAVTWYVSSTDTIVRWNNLASETWVDASHTRTTAATTDYHDIDYPGWLELHDIDSIGGSGFTQSDSVTIPAYVVTDTVTVGARTETVATQTYTITQGRVPWRYLRVAATGAGSGAGCSITSFTVAILRED